MRRSLLLSCVIVTALAAGLTLRAQAEGTAGEGEKLWSLGWSSDGGAALFRYERQTGAQQVAGYRLLSLRARQRVEVVLSMRVDAGVEQLSTRACQKALASFALNLKAHGFADVAVRPAACNRDRATALRTTKRLADGFETSLMSARWPIDVVCSTAGLHVTRAVGTTRETQLVPWSKPGPACVELRVAVSHHGRSVLVLRWGGDAFASVVAALDADGQGRYQVVETVSR